MGKGAINKHMKAKKHVSVDQSCQSMSAGLMASWTRPSQSSDPSDINRQKSHGVDSIVETRSDNVMKEPEVEKNQDVGTLKVQSVDGQ